MAQELIWLTLLALAVVVVLTGWMKYLRKPAWSGRAFAVLVLTNLPTLGLLVVGALAVVEQWPILRAIAPLLLFVGALLQVVHATEDARKLGVRERDALALSGWIAVLFGAGWAAVDALI
ncbi:hypothetical protein [Plantibacter flavus]|uniref:hypothetical protein n=1 Tax=Plantibacter flavus TaxID=150123 RepID=UPI0033975412